MDAEFDELKREFLAEAATKIEEIQTLSGTDDQKAIERIIYLAHQLKGAGGSYGFQKISNEAAQLEAICESRLQGGNSDGIGVTIGRLNDEVTERSRELMVAEQ